MESEKKIKLVRLEKAASLPFSPVDKLKIEKLTSRIPHNLRGVFGVMIPETDDDTTPVLLGMVVQADPVLRALGRLYDHSSNEAQRSHEMSYHGTAQMLKFEGDSLLHLIDSTLDENEASRKHTAAIKSASNLRNGTLSSKTTFDLDEASRKTLTSKDKQRIEKMKAVIPENVRGFFMCDLTESNKNSKKLEIDRIVLDPNTAMKMIGAYTDTRSGHPARTHVINRQDFKKIAEELPQPGRTKN